MHVAVLGAGVVGVSSAYYLATRGHDVTLFDRAPEPAAGTSHANGGQLAYSFADALAHPSMLAAIPGMLLGRDPAMQVNLWSDLSLVGWGMSFLAQCTAKRARANTGAVLALARESAMRLDEIADATGVDYAHVKSGKLMLLPPGSNLDAARKSVELKCAQGCETALLTMQQAVALSPQLAHFPLDYAAAVHAPGDAVGDARDFSIRLAAWLQEHRSVECRYGVQVTSIDVRSGKARGVATDKGLVSADAVLVCLGSDSPALLRSTGLRMPIYPLRGYSITLPPGSAVPEISITDVKRRIVFSRLGGRIRIAGLADFVGPDHARDAERIADMKKTAMTIAPEFADYGATDVEGWAGDRPMTPDSRPRVGASSIPGLYLNCGHGMLGWTLAAATAHSVAAEISAADR